MSAEGTFFMKAKHIKGYYVPFMYMLYETYSATSVCTGKQMNISKASAEEKKLKITILRTWSYEYPTKMDTAEVKTCVRFGGY